MSDVFKNSTEIMLALTEELGEVATEIALLEKIGTKSSWDKEGSIERLASEIGHVKNLCNALLEHYSIDPPNNH